MHRHDAVVRWLRARVGQPVAMWGVAVSGATAIRFPDGARVELVVPPALDHLAVTQLSSGAAVSVSEVRDDGDGFSVGIADGHLHQVRAAEVVYDPSTQRRGARWVSHLG